MTIRRIAFAFIALALGAYALLSGAEDRPQAPRLPSVADAPTAPRLMPLPALDTRADRERTQRARYALTVNVTSLLGEAEGPGIELEGIWTTEPLRDGRVAATLSAVRLNAHPLLPTPEEAAGRLELIVVDGVVEGLGFAPRTSRRSQRLLSSLATLLWPAVQAGDRWTIEQEDLSGLHAATYTRVDDQTIERRVEQVLAMRAPGGLDADAAENATPSGTSTFAFDAQGLKTAQIRDDRRIEMSGAALVVTSQVRATLKRLDTQVVDLRAPVPFPAGTFDLHVDLGQQTAQIDDSLVNGADLPTLLSVLDTALQSGDQETRSHALERLTALVRIDPSVAPEIASELAELTAEDRARVSYLAGALSSANTPAATNALAGILDEDLHRTVRHSVHSNLALTEAPTAESFDALQADLEGELDRSAAMALGSQAHQMEAQSEGDTPSEPVKSALEQLIERYQAAQTPDERIAAIKALGNSGNPMVLPVLTEATQDGHPAVAYHAVRALRFIPGETVDALLAAKLDAGEHVRAVVEAAGFRDGRIWGPKLAQVREQFEGDEGLTQAIDQLLQRWS